ncbi:hypothetical protein NP493_384g01033 [Ridgeia piscesae]|uniref:Uncharacterized protein n=1 Tax=Ridgeia piscesae TaxID=27915 RepID=A0AAD9NVS4_RIDPI|nr:hypothetical protein NP493_384g01033 [Ridgeia piscesae]
MHDQLFAAFCVGAFSRHYSIHLLCVSYVLFIDVTLGRQMATLLHRRCYLAATFTALGCCSAHSAATVTASVVMVSVNPSSEPVNSANHDTDGQLLLCTSNILTTRMDPINTQVTNASDSSRTCGRGQFSPRPF